MGRLIPGVSMTTFQMGSGCYQVRVHLLFRKNGRVTTYGKFLGTPSYARLFTIATERTLLKDMEQLSSLGQTYGLESYHSLLTKFAPKSVAFTSETMRARYVPGKA